MAADTIAKESSQQQSCASSYHPQHIFQHQSSVASTTSVQTVLHQFNTSINNATTTDSCHSVHESMSSASFQSLTTAATISSTASTSTPPSAAAPQHTINGNNVIITQKTTSQQNQPPHKKMSISSYNQLTGAATPAAVAAAGVDETLLSIGDVADLLHPQYAIITGGRSREGCALITFPDHANFHTLADCDYNKLIFYLTSVPSLVFFLSTKQTKIISSNSPDYKKPI